MNLADCIKNNRPCRAGIARGQRLLNSARAPTQGRQYYFIHPKVDALITPTFKAQHDPMHSDADRPIKLMQAVLEDRSLAVLPPKVDDWIITGF